MLWPKFDQHKKVFNEVVKHAEKTFQWSGKIDDMFSERGQQNVIGAWIWSECWALPCVWSAGAVSAARLSLTGTMRRTAVSSVRRTTGLSLESCVMAVQSPSPPDSSWWVQTVRNPISASLLTPQSCCPPVCPTVSHSRSSYTALQWFSIHTVTAAVSLMSRSTALLCAFMKELLSIIQTQTSWRQSLCGLLF